MKITGMIKLEILKAITNLVKKLGGVIKGQVAGLDTS